MSLNKSAGDQTIKGSIIDVLTINAVIKIFIFLFFNKNSAIKGNANIENWRNVKNAPKNIPASISLFFKVKTEKPRRKK